jgi:hypothetical protein
MRTSEMHFAAHGGLDRSRPSSVETGIITTAADSLRWTPGESPREMVRWVHTLSTPMCMLSPRTRAYSVAP